MELLAQGDLNPLWLVGLIVVIIIMLIAFAVFASYFRLWLQSFLTQAGITIWEAKVDFDAALPTLRESIQDYPWDDWQTQKTDIMLTDVVFINGEPPD